MKNDDTMQFDWGRVLLALIFFFAFIFLGSRFLGTEDFAYVLMWWATLLLFGVAMQPLCICLFSRFHDGGWVFSKAIGIGVCGWVVWYLSSCKLVKFTRTACYLITILCLIIGAVLFYALILKKNRKYRITEFYTAERLTSMLSSEVLFFGVFVFWCYLKGINPAAYGTERFMDYSYMLSIFKSDYMPPKDMWLSGKSINYYYVGQYYGAFVSKTAGVPVTHGYNIAMMMLPAFGFCMPYSIVVNLMKTRLKDRQKKISEKELNQATLLGEAVGTEEPFFRPVLAGVLAGLAVCFSSTMQYPIYKFIVPKLQKLLGKETFGNYWFSNATRYIGYFPERDDKTIHEFPLYSYVIGDLHAHVVNTIFVMSILAILLAWMLKKKDTFDLVREASASRFRLKKKEEKAKRKEQEGEYSDAVMLVEDNAKPRFIEMLKNICDKPFFKEVFDPNVVACAFFVGLSLMTNSWDFPIYFVVCGAIILFTNLVTNDFDVRAWYLTGFQALVFIVASVFVSLPFTLSFDSISTGIGVTARHTKFYEFLVVWGLPVIAVTVFLCYLIKKEKEKKEKHDGRSWIIRFFTSMSVSELYAITVALCAVGLILIPEVIYVRDIYGGAYERANTMFKLTYQAFIMFGITVSFIVMECVFIPKTKFRKAFGCIALVLMLTEVGYFNQCYEDWFSGYYSSLDCTAFIENENPDDAEMIDYINNNIEGQPVIAEMCGLSYTFFNRVSAFTACPTILGWHTHEYLWRSEGKPQTPEVVIEREQDVKTLYSSQDVNEVLAIIEKYDIDYIYYGECERVFGNAQYSDINGLDVPTKYLYGSYYEKLDSNLNVLLSVGDVVKCINPTDGKSYSTYLIKVRK